MSLDWLNEDTDELVENIHVGLDIELDAIAEDAYPGERGWVANSMPHFDEDYLNIAILTDAIEARLDLEELKVLRLYYFNEWGLKEIAENMGITLEQAQSLIESGIKRIGRAFSDVMNGEV